MLPNFTHPLSYTTQMANFEELCRAIDVGDHRTVKKLTENPRTEISAICVEAAIYGRHSKILKQLILSGAPLHTAVRQLSAMAASGIHSDSMTTIIKLLAHADVPIMSAFRDAVQYGHLETVKCFCTAVPDCITDSQLATDAAYFNRLEILKYLESKGASITNIPGSEKTPLDYAVMRKNTDICEYILSHSDRATVAMEMDKALASRNFPYFKMLKEHGASFATNNYRALEIAARDGLTDFVKYMVVESPPNAIPPATFTNAVRIAAFQNKLDIVKILIEAGANITPIYREMLADAVWHGYHDLMGFLCKLRDSIEGRP